MHPNAERIQAELEARGAGGKVVELAASTRTSQEAAAAIGTTVAQIAKSLVFLAGETPVLPILVIASGINRVSMEKLAAHLGTPATRPDAETVKRLTGFPIGGVSPVGHAVPLRALIDRDLLQYEEIWAAAGTPNAVFRTTPEELARITGGEVVDVREESGLTETAHLLGSPKNAERLLTALERANAGAVESQTAEELRREVGLDPKE
jgi:prolyl-tRNA editing enzyme YbaK/EbsC (Cys-tRNA(Pro) deacylase)